CIVRVGRDDYFQTRRIGIPVLKVLRVLCTQLSGITCRPTEDNRTRELTTAHLVQFCCRIDNLVNSDQREIECHEFYNRFQAVHGSTYTDTRKTKLCNRRIDDTFCSEFL